jgi:hypothetical protein
MAKKARASGMNPPAAGASPRGKLERTSAQQREYRKLIGKMGEMESAGRAYWLRHSYHRGGHARKLLSKKNKETYGEVSVDCIAADLGIGRLSLQQCIKFHNHISTATLEELRALPQPPSWRMMGKWTGFSDSDRVIVLKEILAGNLGPAGFDDAVRKLLKRGPKKPRIAVKNAPQAFKRIGAEAATMVAHLERVPEAAKNLQAIEDTVQRREARTAVRDAVKQMKAALAKLKSTIAECEKLV